MRAVVAILGAAIPLLILASRIPRAITHKTDIVGYPIFYNFNIERVDDLYYLGLVAFPVLSLLFYLALSHSRSFGWRGWLPLPSVSGRSRVDEIRAPSVAHVRVTAVTRVLFVGLVFGFEAAIVFNQTGSRFWLTIAVASLAYLVLSTGLGAVVARLTRSPGRLSDGVATVNAAVVPLVFLGLVGVSGVTSVRVTSNGVVHSYPWFPLWLGVAATVVIGALIWTRLVLASPGIDRRGLERKVVLLVTAPVLIFLVVANLPGDLSTLDAFHGGEYLAASRLTAAGYFPWRDLMSTHGLLEDSLWPLVGSTVLEPSRWGIDASRTLLLAPLTFVFFYLLFVRLFSLDWAFLATLAVVMFGEKLVPFGDARLMFWPLVLVLLSVVLEHRQWWLGAALGVSLIVQAILVPESAYCIPACGVVLILYEVANGRPGERLLSRFPRTLGCIVGGASAALIFGGVLALEHAAASFAFYYLIFAPGHALTGGYPIEFHLHDPLFAYLALAPVGALLIAAWYFGALFVGRRQLTNQEWVIAASAVCALLYYPKFLDRGDVSHAIQAYLPAVPLIAFLVYVAISAANRWLARVHIGDYRPRIAAWRPAAVGLFALALLTMQVGPIPVQLDELAGQYRPVAAAEPAIPQLGYSRNAFDPSQLADLKAVLGAYLGPGDWVFDFSNAPAVYYYLLGQNPHTRYYHVSMAIPELAQRDLIDELKNNPPKLIVYDSDRWGQPGWDAIPNMVRHYDVSQYILDNYRPLIRIHGQIIYGDAKANLSPEVALSLNLGAPVESGDLPFSGEICNWGFSPNFLVTSPPAGARGRRPVVVGIQQLGVGDSAATGWAGDPATGQPASKVVIVAGGQTVATVAPTQSRPDVAASTGVSGFANSGFQVAIPTERLAGAAGPVPIQVFGVSGSGRASILPFGLGVPDIEKAAGEPRSIQLEDGQLVPVQEGAVTGYIDSFVFGRQQSAISLPAGDSWSNYRSIEITSANGFQADNWSLGDMAGPIPQHEVMFQTLVSSPRSLAVKVGSCPQWHGYEPGQLYIRHERTEDIAMVRLLP
jgi:hypothetical protein